MPTPKEIKDSFKEKDKYFELNYYDVSKGKALTKIEASKNVFSYPSYTAVLDERWRAEITKWKKFDVKLTPPGSNLQVTVPELIRILINVCSQQGLIAEQREIYYAIRGLYPNLKIEDNTWEDSYNTFISNYINVVQMALRMPMQSFGVEAGSRGAAAGEGMLVLENGTRVSLDAQPKLRFELTRDNVKYYGHARKHIHYEKEAGFARLINDNISEMIEAIFSTSSGYSSEAASKFLRDSEERGIQTYCIHDADPHGIQMQMMYGVASKNNCYMTDRFYPHNVKYLGLVPTVAKEMGLPPERVEDSDRKIIPNLRRLLSEKGTFLADIDIIDKKGQKWEYQSLNAVNERAPQIYMVEALMARNDEIKYVPVELKEPIANDIRDDVNTYLDKQINSYTDSYYNTNIRPKLIEELKRVIKPDLDKFNIMIDNELPKLDQMDNSDIREAVKLKLVNNPRQFWDTAKNQVARDMIDKKFDISAEIEWDLEVMSGSAEKSLDIHEPIIPENPLIKTDIVDSIEKRIISQKPARDKVVEPIRKALAKVFGKPDLTW